MKGMRNMVLFMTLLLGISGIALAGNNKRAGQAGASELLVNPWSRGTGMGNAGSVLSKGLEAIELNVAGLAEVRKLEINFSHRNWLNASGVDINTLGLAAHVGESGVLGIQLMTVTFGEIENTTVELPEGGQGTFSPLFLTMGLAYSKSFSTRINAGLNVKVVHEETTNLSADGIALDAGVNYTAGFKREIKFGIALRNVGPAIKYKGSGLGTTGTIPGSQGNQISLEQKSQSFELPSLLNIGLSYDLLFTEISDTSNRGVRAMHRITPAGNFTSNSFTPDLFAIGLEYAFKEMFMARVGYIIPGKAGDSGQGSMTLTGISAGFTVEYPMSRRKNSGTLALDFSWQDTDNFGGITSFGIRLNL